MLRQQLTIGELRRVDDTGHDSLVVSEKEETHRGCIVESDRGEGGQYRLNMTHQNKARDAPVVVIAVMSRVPRSPRYRRGRTSAGHSFRGCLALTAGILGSCCPATVEAGDDMLEEGDDVRGGSGES